MSTQVTENAHIGWKRIDSAKIAAAMKSDERAPKIANAKVAVYPKGHKLEGQLMYPSYLPIKFTKTVYVVGDSVKVTEDNVTDINQGIDLAARRVVTEPIIKSFGTKVSATTPSGEIENSVL